MADLYFSEQADTLLDELERSPTRKNLLIRLNVALDMLEANPRDIRCRRRRFDSFGCWAITVTSNEGEWIILWEERDETASIVAVRAITADPC